MSANDGDLVPQDDSTRAAERDHVLLQALFELATAGFQLIDVTGRKAVAVNSALTQITGYSREELLYGDGQERFPPEWRPVRASWFVQAATEGHFGPSEVEYFHKLGHRISLVFSGVGVVDGSGHRYLWLNVQDVTRYRAMERELRAAASEDRLTGLANRATLLRALQQRVAEAEGAPTLGGDFAVMFLDFDRFKLVNDTLGHDAGDALLREIAQRLREAAERRGGTSGAWLAARFGGDEFVLLVNGVPDELAARREADALLVALAAPYTIKGQTVHSSASIGIARWTPESGDGEALLRDADIAMYEAKRRGRRNCVMFDATMRAQLTRALIVERELRQALALGQVRLDWQPVIDLDTGHAVAAEALLRWRHPTLGEIAPAEMLPAAEESGQMAALGEWALREACRQWAAWQRELGPGAAPAVVGVNLSRQQLASGLKLVATVRDALAAAGMPAQALQLDIAEAHVLKDGAVVRAVMRDLATLGVALAMDDFGTGSPSLACLRDFPFNAIKIDRSFVTGLFHDRHVLAVAHATVSVIENLGMTSIAEGIEDPSELATLQSLGCRCGQGRLFSPPVGAAELPGALARLAAGGPPPALAA